MNWTDFHFLRPLWFLALVPGAFILWHLLIQRRKKNFWQDKIDKHLLNQLLVGGSTRQSNANLLLLAFAWFLAIFILSAPVWEKRQTPVFRSNNNLAVVLDLSRSMNANDLIPSRLEFVKIPLMKHLTQSNDNRVALIVFAEHAYIASPLAQDFVSTLDLVRYANTDIMPVQGSRPDRGMLKAIELLQKNTESPGQILLITDGPAKNSEGQLKQAIKLAGEHDYKVSILAVGTVQGSPIPLAQGKARRVQKEFLTSTFGQSIVTKVDHNFLRQMANLGKGNFNVLNSNKDKPGKLVPYSSNILDDSNKNPADKAPQWKEYSPYLLFLLIPLTSLAFRRGWVGSFVLILLFSFSSTYSETSMAETRPKIDKNSIKAFWDDIWIRPDYQAYEFFKRNRMQSAAEKFKDPLWEGSSWYRMGEFKKAEHAFLGVDTATGHFNRGNALAQQGLIKEAIDAYSIALSYDMNLKDAKVNRKLLKTFLDEKKQNKEKKSPSQNKNSNQGLGQSSGKVSSDNSRETSQDKKQSQRQDQQGEKNKKAVEEDKESKKGKTSDEAVKDSENKKTSEAEAANDKALAVQFKKEIKQSSTIGPEQWLNMIKDDPAELLKLKLYSEYIKSGQGNSEKHQEW